MSMVQGQTGSRNLTDLNRHCTTHPDDASNQISNQSNIKTTEKSLMKMYVFKGRVQFNAPIA